MIKKLKDMTEQEKIQYYLTFNGLRAKGVDKWNAIKWARRVVSRIGIDK